MIDASKQLPMSAPVAPPVEAGRWSGFFRLPLAERQRRVALVAGLSERETRILSGDEGLSAELADHMVENAVGVATLPVGICVHLRVDGCDRVVPMAIEEPSVIAAASHAAKLLRTGGGVHTRVSPAHMIGQIQVLGVPDPAAAEAAIRGARAEIIARANACDPPLCACGGGAVDIDVRHLPPAGDGDPLGPMLVVHLIVDVRDAMGANAVNTMCERLAGRVEELSGGRVRLRILSNLADRRLVVASGRVPFAALRAKGESSPEALARGIEEASVFAERDPYRAATHNKGIMNGVDAVLVAFGQDWRAVEAGAHAYAARGGRYTALSRWRVVDGALCGTLELPLAVGVVGGVSKVHPGCQVARRVAGVRSAADLASLAAAVGLAQNLGALRALAAEGIQTGHMRVHARGVALAAGAIGPEVDGVARAIAAGARPLRPAAARAALRAAREPAARWDARAVEGRLGELGERYLQPIAELAETAFVPSDGERRCALLPLCVAEVLGLDPARLLPFGAACALACRALRRPGEAYPFTAFPRQQGRLAESAAIAAYVLGPAPHVQEYAPGRASGRARARGRLTSRLGECVNAYGEAGLLRALSLLDRLDVPLARRESVRRRAIREMLRALAPAGRGAQHAAAEQHAAVLFALPLAGAVELCGAGDEAVAAVEKAARQLGVLCRLREEVLGHGAGNGREGGAVPRAALLAEMARRRRRAVRSAAAADHPGLAAIVEGLGAWFAEPVAHLVARPGPAPPAWDGQGAGVLT